MVFVVLEEGVNVDCLRLSIAMGSLVSIVPFQASFNSVDRELQEEIKSLQDLESKAKKLEEEFNEILKEREKEDEKRRLRLEKIKQKFRIVAKLHAYFMKPKDQSAPDAVTGSSKTSKKNRSSMRNNKQARP